MVYCYKRISLLYAIVFQARVRFLAYHRIKPHVPPLVRAPVNSFEFQPCGRTPQVDNLMVSLRRSNLNPNIQLSSFTAWTTRVSNPVWSPRFRSSASVDDLDSCLRYRCSETYLCISPLLVSFRHRRSYSSLTVSTAAPELSSGISPLTYKAAYEPFKPNKSG